MRQKRTKKKNNLFKTMLILVMIIGISFFGFKKISHSKKISNIKETYSTEINPNSDNKLIGNVKSIVEYDLDHVVAVHYPVLENENLDPKIETYANSFVDKFKKDADLKAKNNKTEELPIVHLDYNSYGFKDQFVSLNFYGKESIPSKNTKDTYSDFFVYDLNTGKDVKLDDIFLEQAARPIATFINSVDNGELEPKIENFDKFLIKDKAVTFFIDKDGVLNEYSMELSDLEDYLKYDLNTGKRLSDEEIEEKSKNVFGGARVRTNLDPNKPMVALTFDDGPYRNITTPILDVLEKHNAVATFFVLGNRVPSNEDILQRALAGGSELANHSYDHTQLNAISLDKLNYQINTTQDAIKTASGVDSRLLRPTYGAINDTMRNNVDLPMILWSIDTLDWKYKNSQRIINHVLTNVRDGDIILMHDMYPTTNQATQVLVPELINRGFQLVTVSELYELKGIPLEPGKTYTNIK